VQLFSHTAPALHAQELHPPAPHTHKKKRFGFQNISDFLGLGMLKMQMKTHKKKEVAADLFLHTLQPTLQPQTPFSTPSLLKDKPHTSTET
jgi:hypothetical protein